MFGMFRKRNRDPVPRRGSYDARRDKYGNLHQWAVPAGSKMIRKAVKARTGFRMDYESALNHYRNSSEGDKFERTGKHTMSGKFHQ